MFSSRIPSDRSRNRLADAIARLEASGTAYVDLTESNPTRVGIEYPSGILDTLRDPSGLDYRPAPFGLPSARRAVAGELARRGLEVAPDRMVLTTGTSESVSLLFKLLCNPGDRVLVARPTYPLFDHLAGLDGVEIAPFDVVLDAGRWRIDFESLERAATAGARAVLVVSPNNPTGACLTREEIDRLGAFCASRSLALIGDEVFADYSWSAASPPSVLTQHAALAFSLGGLSKSCGLPQLKLGWIAAGGPERLVREALDRLEIACDAYLSVSTPVQLALPSLLSSGALVRDRIRTRIGTNLAALDAALRSHPSLRRLPADAGWYAVLALPASLSEESLVLSLLERDHVLVHPGFFFDFASDGYVVVSLLPRPADFSRGLAALLRRIVA